MQPYERQPRPLFSPATHRVPWTVLFAVALLCAAVAATGAIHIVRNLPLGAGLSAEVADDGSLVLREEATGVPVVTAKLETTGGRRTPHATEPVFVGRTTDGAASGHRGFAAGADDDKDGSVDEDRLDGRDNDGDGLIDEDHAAIGDAMIAVSSTDGTHAEFYHWTRRPLHATVFASLTATGPGRSSWRLEAGGSDWVEVAMDVARHRVTGRAAAVAVHAFVTMIDTAPDKRARWVGVSVLDEPTGDGMGRTVLDGEYLLVRLGGRPVSLAVSTADSWLGLTRRLAEAHVVRDGVTDPVDGRHIPWIVLPGCASCRQAAPPPFRWRLDGSGHLILLADIEPGTCAQLDPDLFRLDNRDLGAPDQIFWSTRAGGETGIAWSAVTPERIARAGTAPSCPYLVLEGLADHNATGTLGFRFRAPHPALVRRFTDGEAPTEMTVVFPDGRTATTKLEFDLESVDPVRSAIAWAARSGPESAPTAMDQQRLLEPGRTHPTLSPALLEGWPNPFHDTINLRFRIPTTMGEAFVWEDPDDRPEHLDLQAAIPWARSEPAVSVKVYGINGQELATLHEGSLASGELTVHWGGTDAFGRKVASGTYFCKLQLDDWSVTRRIVFVR